ncbi:MAG: Gfo/Idh/MocA family oxidoreductase [Halieaceae bacterium]|jgi:predicted dehydrogenase|nr:Gfo/Idh/MocA family oxidoreductase [Halieaceae bacterium]
MTIKTNTSNGANYAPSTQAKKVVAPDEFNFAAAYLNHGHIYGQTNGLCDAGGTLKYVYDPDPERVEAFVQRYPGTQVAASFDQILDANDIHLIAAAAIPCQRGPIGIRVMRAGKDYFTDKAPFTSLDQLADARLTCEQTGQKYMVYYSERVHNDAAWQAGELISQGAIGEVLQVLNIAPHRLAAATRPDWFFDREQYGGILVDLGSHQVEQFLAYSGSTDATVNFARASNFNNPDTPGLEDFGELSLTGNIGRGDGGSSFYARVDWFTPDGMSGWGDGRSFIVGSKGTMELRKYLDVGRQAPSSKLFVVDTEREQELECLDQSGFPFFGQLILDVLNRTEIAMTQAHAFKAAELCLQAQRMANAGQV